MIALRARILTLPILAVVLASACNGKDEAPMVPLGQAPATGTSPHGPISGITGDAKVALDSGNKLYSAKAYALALAQYRRAAALAPTAEAPLFGILMVASVTNDAALTDSATKALRSLDPAGGDSTGNELVDIHSRLRTPPPTQ